MAEYIDKSTLLRSFAPIYEHDRYTGLTFETAKQIIADHINSLPTIDAEPVKHGRWIKEPNCWYRCSVCGEHYPSLRGYMTYNYCPNCGAKMDLGEVKE